MRLGNAKAAAGTAALGFILAAVAAVGGWPPAAVVVIAVTGLAAAAYVALRARRHALRGRDPARDPDLMTRRADGPWSAYDRRRSAVVDARSPARRDRSGVADEV